ncbi:MAG: HAD-IA family hydrolase [Deltaproteobacteria bacterium]|nr:HAD-IA family hydrolase [Deltaproteobacteria bacterium]
MHVAAVIFDLDGTLVDSLGGITAALNAALAAAGFPPVDAARVRGIVGDGPRLLCRRALGEAGDDAAVLERVLGDFRERYTAAPLHDTRTYPGVPAMLARLAPRPLGVCTNKGRRLVELVVEGLGLRPYLADLVAEDDLPWRKPDPRPLRVLGGRLGAPPAATLVVGDGLQDLRAARAAGMPCCAVLGGYTDPALLRAEAPELLVETVAELPDRLG